MSLSLEERKLQYIQTVETEYMPAEKNYWQHPPPTYRLTSDYTTGYGKALISGEPAIFKKTRKEGLLVTVMVIVALLLIYMVGEKEFGFIYVAFLLFLLIIVLPVLLNNKIMIRVDRESIWLHKENKEIKWKQVLRTYIKEVHEEHTQYFFIVHYYDEVTDEFRRSEIELKELVYPGALPGKTTAHL